MYGGVDADVMVGGKGDDVMYGGDGIVDANGVLDVEPLVGVGLLDDSLSGGEGNDTLYGGGGWDALSGNSGHDILIPGTGGADQLGRESMDGGHGDDIYILEDAADFPNMDILDGGLTQLELVTRGPASGRATDLGSTSCASPTRWPATSSWPEPTFWAWRRSSLVWSAS
jgi:Ca2+-binding RTX toxin-like protein